VALASSEHFCEDPGASPALGRAWGSSRWHNEAMPAIDAPTVAEHRQRRHDALIAATCTILLNEGAAAVTMASVAARTGLSRTAIYEYYRSANDIVADVVVDEMLAWNDHLTAATADIADPGQRLEAWLRAALGYVTDGRHAIVRATADASLPPARRAQVRSLHPHSLNFTSPNLNRLPPLSGAPSMRPHGASKQVVPAKMRWTQLSPSLSPASPLSLSRPISDFKLLLAHERGKFGVARGGHHHGAVAVSNEASNGLGVKINAAVGAGDGRR
jgi:AcrR family transcriptional regulator